MDKRLDAYNVFLFDLDGVLTDTARVHAACWKEMFDEYLAERSERFDEPFVEFGLESDYHPYVDGKPRFDGVRDFLASRGIELPLGTPEDPVEAETICGLGNRKNVRINAMIDNGAVAPHPGSVDLLNALRERGAHMAVVTSSQNAKRTLAAAGLSEYFETIVDGNVAIELKLAGKPAPDTFIEAARELSATPAQAVVFEDALSGVQAGAAGQFGLVIGIARKDNDQDLANAGADIVISDLSMLL